jgi:hypothetical protein
MAVERATSSTFASFSPRGRPFVDFSAVRFASWRDDGFLCFKVLIQASSTSCSPGARGKIGEVRRSQIAGALTSLNASLHASG